MKDQNKEEFID